ncbi:zf-C3HC-domain-containing protein [Rhypophila decipiens]|uniref:Zf-C3HC-domain-containing protein n=1 Tax=Rhypophila decipiens TaxID=261697 RepID=A0AAN6YLI3_9PEZI|nr:zf-C3HC-domain-containing protein [Rhypophila decipiens]
MNATVKRKFNALLQGIGNSSSTSVNTTSNKRPSSVAGLDEEADAANDSSINRVPSTSSSPLSARMASEEFLSKKRRVGASQSQPIFVGASTPRRYGSPQTPSTRGATTISNITLKKWTPSGGTPEPGSTPGREGQLPKYCPGDREQLLRRLATFQELTEWAPKPDAVNEVEWAKRGWVCQGKERVRCTLCSKEIVVKINRKEIDGKEIAVMIASEISQSVVDMYKDMIISSHAEDCLWRRRGCDDSLLRLPYPNSKLALETLRQRYDQLLERKDFLPAESSLRLPEGLDIDVILTYLPPNFCTEPPPHTTNPTTTPPATTTAPNRVSLSLALLGWQGHSDARVGHVSNSASCATCLRRLGLWMFIPKDPSTPAVMDHLDPLREHRFFCPWKNGAMQRNPGAKPDPKGGDKPAWEILVQSLRNEAFIRQRTSVVHSRSKSTVAGPAGGGAAGRREDVMRTPERRPMTSDGRADQTSPLQSPGLEEPEEEEEDEETKKKKDQDMMSRLRRVKSLFNAKAGSKLKKFSSSSSRPGTSHSTVSRTSKAGE